MAVDGYLNFDTKVDTSGFEKGIASISKVLKTLDKSIKELSTVLGSVSNIKFSADTSEAEKAISNVAESIENISDTETKVEADTSDFREQIEVAFDMIPNAEIDVNADTFYVDQAINSIENELYALDNRQVSPEIEPDISGIEPIVFDFQSDMGKISEASENASEEISEDFDEAGSNMKKSIDSSSDSISDALDKLKSQLKGVAAAVGIAFGVKEIISFGKKAIESAAEVNAANSQLEQTFGSLQSTAEEAMQRVADASGIAATRLKGVGTSIYAFAKTSGMDSVQALDMMEEALQVAADSAAYYDRSLEDTSETLKSFLKGNYENDAALGISSTETTRNAMANKLYGKSFKELSEAQKQLALLQMVKDANDLSGATGQAAREADGWENVIGNLKETWKQLIAVIGQPLLKAAVSVVKELTSALSFLLEKAQIAVNTLSELFGWELGNTASVADNISQSVTSQNELTEAVEETTKANEKSVAGFDKINTLAEKTVESEEKSGGIDQISTPTGAATLAVAADTSEASRSIQNFVGRVQSVFSQLQNWLKKNFSPISKNIWSGLVSETHELYGTIKQIFSDIQALGQPLAEYFQGDFTVMLQSALTVIGDILIGLYDSFNLIFADIWGIAVYPALADFITIGLPIITQFTTEALNAFGVLFDEVKLLFDILWEDVARPVLGFVAELWHDLMVSLQKFWDKWGKPIFEKFCTAITLTGETLRNIWKSFLKPIFDKIMEVLDDIWTEHLKPLVDNFLDFVGVLITGALDIYNGFILPVINWFVEKFGPPIAKVFGFIAETVGNVIGGVIDAVSHIIDALKGVIDFVAGIFTGDWRRAWQGIKKIFSGIWNALVDIVKVPINLIIDLVNGLTGAIESGLNFLIDSINTLSWDVPDWVPIIGGETFGFDIPNVDIPEIPHLATGTVVPANYGNFLAVLGDNKRETEVVSPLSTIKKAVAEAMAESGGKTPQTINLTTYLWPNSSAFHREVIKIVNSDKARRGG